MRTLISKILAFQVLFPEPVVWIVFGVSPDEIQKFYFPPNTNFFLVQSTLDKAHVYRVRGRQKGHKMVVEDFGIWSNGQAINPPVDYSSEKVDLQNVPLTAMLHLVNRTIFLKPTNRGSNNFAKQLKIYANDSGVKLKILHFY